MIPYSIEGGTKRCRLLRNCSSTHHPIGFGCLGFALPRPSVPSLPVRMSPCSIRSRRFLTPRLRCSRKGQALLKPSAPKCFRRGSRLIRRVFEEDPSEGLRSLAPLRGPYPEGHSPQSK